MALVLIKNITTGRAPSPPLFNYKNPRAVKPGGSNDQSLCKFYQMNLDSVLEIFYNYYGAVNRRGGQPLEERG